MGLETSPALASAYAPAFWWFHALVQAAFVVEIGIRLLAHGARPAAFFRDGWNTFDFAVGGGRAGARRGPLATIARLGPHPANRAPRVDGAGAAADRGTMLRSIRRCGHVLMLLACCCTATGSSACRCFGSHDPARWGSLGRALMTLFEVMTLEGWVEMMEASLAASPWAWIFYVSFIVVTVFIVVNLFHRRRDQQSGCDESGGGGRRTACWRSGRRLRRVKRSSPRSRRT